MAALANGASLDPQIRSRAASSTSGQSRIRGYVLGARMNIPTRRTFVKSATAVVSGICTAGVVGGFTILSRDKKKADVRIEDVSISFEEFVFRTPLKFAQTVVDRQTMLTVECTVRSAEGKEAKGFGTLPLN